MQLNAANKGVTLEAVQKQYGNLTVIDRVENVRMCGCVSVLPLDAWMHACGCLNQSIARKRPADDGGINLFFTLSHTNPPPRQFGPVYNERIAKLKDQCHVLIKVNNDVRARSSFFPCWTTHRMSDIYT